MPTRPLREFDPTKALDLLDQIEALIGQYNDLTGRHAQSDIDLRWRLSDKADEGEISLDPENAMVAFYQSGEKPYIHGDDGWSEASYYGFIDDVVNAAERIGIRQNPYAEDPEHSMFGAIEATSHTERTAE